MKRISAIERIRRHTEQGANGCLLWTGSIGKTGYGKVSVILADDWREGQVMLPAHRYVWEETVGPIPEGLTVDHLCRNRQCVNVKHLELVPMRENVLRGTGPSADNAKKTHCKHGHELAGDNLILSTVNGQTWRRCRECRRRRGREWAKRNRAKAGV